MKELIYLNIVVVDNCVPGYSFETRIYSDSHVETCDRYFDPDELIYLNVVVVDNCVPGFSYEIRTYSDAWIETAILYNGERHPVESRHFDSTFTEE